MSKLAGRRAGRYSRVTSWIIDQKVILGVYMLADVEGLACVATNAEIARATGVGLQSVARCIDDMEEKGLITTIGYLSNHKRRTIVLDDHDRAEEFIDSALADPGEGAYLLADAPQFSRSSKAQASGIAVWAAVRSLADGGVCTRTNAEIADAAGLAADTVKSKLRRLESEGYLARVDGPFGQSSRALVLLDHPGSKGIVAELRARMSGTQWDWETIYREMKSQ